MLKIDHSICRQWYKKASKTVKGMSWLLLNATKGPLHTVCIYIYGEKMKASPPTTGRQELYHKNHNWWYRDTNPCQADCWYQYSLYGSLISLVFSIYQGFKNSRSNVVFILQQYVILFLIYSTVQRTPCHVYTQTFKIWILSLFIVGGQNYKLKEGNNNLATAYLTWAIIKLAPLNWYNFYLKNYSFSID